MAREWRRLLIDPTRLRAAAGGSVPLEAPERHYLARVLRFRGGERLAVVDGIGHLWSARFTSPAAVVLEQPADRPLQSQPAPRPPLGLALAIPRREADLAWRMATELGADRLQPLLAERGVVGASPPLERWRALLREAGEQSERLWLPELAAPRRSTDWLAKPPPGLGLIALTRAPGTPALEQALQQCGDAELAAGVTLLVGPEGGWSPRELALAETAGWRGVSLGPTILRTGTAAVAGIARLAAWRELRNASFPSPCP